MPTSNEIILLDVLFQKNESKYSQEEIDVAIQSIETLDPEKNFLCCIRYIRRAKCYNSRIPKRLSFPGQTPGFGNKNLIFIFKKVFFYIQTT